MTTPSLLLPDPSLHAVFDFHKKIDALLEKERHKSLGTTKKGIGPTYAAKVKVCVYTLVADGVFIPYYRWGVLE